MNSPLQTSDQRRKMMSRIKGQNTRPELALRRDVRALGLRYRCHYRIGRTRPDIVFVGAKLAVFVDGCFWHCCPLHSRIPKSNRDFWKQKLNRNCERDAATTRLLVAEGWRVLRFWEHEIAASSLYCASRIAALLGRTDEVHA